MLINIIGASGAGKTTLANYLSRICRYPRSSIGHHRVMAVYDEDAWVMEEEAWQSFNYDCENVKDLIITHSGLNGRWQKPDRNDMFTIKLTCTLEDAPKRATPDKGQESIFRDCYGFQELEDFVQYSHYACKRLECDLEIDTSKHGKFVTLLIALFGILKWKVLRRNP
ncbi:MAG: hypothetical protein QMD78_00235 [Methanocellales archaeon]|nr:hypothetical protein [Methanocellales archaeon]